MWLLPSSLSQKNSITFAYEKNNDDFLNTDTSSCKLQCNRYMRDSYKDLWFTAYCRKFDFCYIYTFVIVLCKKAYVHIYDL